MNGSFPVRFIALALFIVIGLPPAGTPAAMDSTSANQPVMLLELDSYVAELERWAAAVADTRLSSRHLSNLRQSLPRTWWVKLEDEPMAISTDWLRVALETWESEPDKGQSVQLNLQAQLEALKREALALSEAPRVPSPIEARDRLTEILKRREFRALREPGWFDRVRQRLGLWLMGLLERLGGLPQIFAARKILVWIIIGLALMTLVLWLKHNWTSAASVKSRAGEVEFPAVMEGKWQDWARRAFEEARRGDYRKAIHSAYWAGIFWLEELGLWSSDHTRTPREYLRLLPAEHAHHPALASLTKRFEMVWYGGRPSIVADFQDATTDLERLGCPLPSSPATESS